jgi:hypothetical protein
MIIDNKQQNLHFFVGMLPPDRDAQPLSVVVEVSSKLKNQIPDSQILSGKVCRIT